MNQPDPEELDRFWNKDYSQRTARTLPANDPVLSWIDPYLPTATEGSSVFEVGCCSGRFFRYFGGRGYKLNGIDFIADVETLGDDLASEGFSTGNFYQEDFTRFEIYQRFSVVCSFGFIEHFEQYLDILQKHVDLLEPGGKLIVEVPNFRGVLQCLMHRLADSANFKRHCIKAMNLKSWIALLKNKGLEIEKVGPIGGFDFWYEPDSRRWIEKGVLKGVCMARPFARAHLRKPSIAYSPYLGCIARMPGP